MPISMLRQHSLRDKMQPSVKGLLFCFSTLGLFGCDRQSTDSTQSSVTPGNAGDQQGVFFDWLHAGAVAARGEIDPNAEIYAAIRRFVTDDQAVLRAELSPRVHYSSSRTVWADGEIPAGWVETMQACVRLRYNPGEELEFARALVVMNGYTYPTYSLSGFDHVAVGKALAAIEDEERYRLSELFRKRGVVSDANGQLVPPTPAELAPPFSALFLLQQRTGFEAALYNNVLIPVVVEWRGLKGEANGGYRWTANSVKPLDDGGKNVCDDLGP